MKYNNILKNIVAGLLLVCVVSSCDDWMDVNTDPNNPTSVTPDLLLPQAQIYTSTNMAAFDGVNHLGNMMAYNWSEAFGFSWYDDEFNYLVNTNFYDDVFDHTYRDALKQYKLLTQLGENHEYYHAIGNIMMAYHFQILVDCYGDVPYSEALLRSENPAPAYDDAKTIYYALVDDLTEAIALIDAGAENPATLSPSTDDITFGGDMAAWKGFANSIKVRLLARMSDLTSEQGYIQTQMDIIAADGSGFITADVATDATFADEEGKQSPLWDEFGFKPGGEDELNYRATCAPQYMIDYLDGTNDPRIDFIYELPATGHLGWNQGFEPTKEYGFEFVSNIGPGILKSATMGTIIFTLAESNFNRAELALKGFGGDAKTLYEAGVTAAFLSLNHDGGSLTAADAALYLAQPVENINYDASTRPLEAIISQKRIAMIGLTAEQSWFDYSRTGYPTGLPVSGQATTDDRPVRLFYPATEKSTNAANVPTQKDAFTAKIFWAN